MRRALMLLSVLLPAAAMAAPESYSLPEETATLAPGPHLELVQQNCGACHSSDYISTQPRPLKDPAAFWTAEVIKMTKVYGAPIDSVDMPKIVEYLAATYGK